jgi:polyferredoxin
MTPMTPVPQDEHEHRHRRRRHRSKHKFRRRMKKLLYWIILPVIGSVILIKTLLFYFSAQ